jgi:hypothetical protein
MRIREVVAPVVAGAFLATGCGAEQSSEPKVITAPKQEQTKSPEQIEIEAYQKSLSDYRNGVLYKHQARILMGSCVAWGNTSGGITVTLNPGIGEVNVNGRKKKYFIFSTHDKRYKPSWGPLNGPELLSVEPIVLAFHPDEPVKGGLLRVLSAKQTRDRNHRTYYMDRQSGNHVLETILEDGPFTEKHVANVCNELRDDGPFSSSSA